jgi:hypothetical protein
MKRTVGALVAVLIGVNAPAYAQSAWTVSFGAGAAAPTSDIASRLSTGWDIDAAVGYQLAPWLTMLGEFGFARMGVPADLLQQFQAPDGHGRIYSLNVDPQVQFPLTAHLQGFVEGGVGWIRRTVELTAPTVQYVDYFDPFYGDLGPQPVTTDQVLSSTTRNAIGVNVGGGVAVPVSNTGASLFVDVRYYRARTKPRITAMIPVLFGIRYSAFKRP